MRCKRSVVVAGDAPSGGCRLPGAGAEARRGRVERMDGRAVDAWACRADEGRGLAAKRLGEP
jgi:hypothetical protein